MRTLVLTEDQNKLTEKSFACAIGNFDGMHLGHQSLIHSVKTYAEKNSIRSSILTFSPSPGIFFGTHTAQDQLFSDVLKEQASREMGLHTLVLQSFDDSFRSFSAKDFISKYLVEDLNIKSLTVGKDFRFGKNREGDIALLKTLGRDHGLNVNIVEPVSMDHEIVSSTRVRKALKAGELAQASKLLNRPYLVSAPIVSGRQLGRQIGFPTLNLDTPKQLLPSSGVYAGFAFVCSTFMPSFDYVLKVPHQAKLAVANIGCRPTVEKSSAKNQMNMEVHMIGESLEFNLPDSTHVFFYFVERLRSEQKFESLEALKAQIKQDIKEAQKIVR